MSATFKGNADHTIDAKFRLSIPAKFRAKLAEGGRKMSWTALPWQPGVLRLYPSDFFDAMAQELGQSIVQKKEESRMMRLLFGMAEEMEQDENGRIRFTQTQLSQAGLGLEVTVTGCGPWLEVSNRDVWQSDSAGAMAELQALIEGGPSASPGSKTEDGA